MFLYGFFLLLMRVCMCVCLCYDGRMGSEDSGKEVCIDLGFRYSTYFGENGESREVG